MIANHQGFIEAIHAKKKVCVRYYSMADSGVVDRVCAPVDYGPGNDNQDGLNRYWLWDSAGNPESHLLGLLGPEIVNIQVLGDVFDPAEVTPGSWPWSIPRNWAGPSENKATGSRPMNGVVS